MEIATRISQYSKTHCFPRNSVHSLTTQVSLLCNNINHCLLLSVVDIYCSDNILLLYIFISKRSHWQLWNLLDFHASFITNERVEARKGGKLIEINFCITGFSLSAWKDKQGIAAADPLPAWAQVLLLEELDIAQYMDSAQCVRGTGLYGNTVKLGTDTGFNQNAATTPQCRILHQYSFLWFI